MRRANMPASWAMTVAVSEQARGTPDAVARAGARPSGFVGTPGLCHWERQARTFGRYLLLSGRGATLRIVKEPVMFRKFAAAQRGQGLVEYALIIFLVAIAVVALLGVLGGQIGAVFTSITNSL